MRVPPRPKLYHIVHVDRLPSIVADDCLWCDREVLRRSPPGTTIGIGSIKARRLNVLRLTSHPDLFVGDCVPFYLCPRSVMLYLIHQGNYRELSYRGGQGQIVHLEADLYATVAWAESQGLRWAFTLSNAGSCYFEDRCNLANLHELDWEAVGANKWSGPGVAKRIKDGKQAEFLIENRFPWPLVGRIGVLSDAIALQVSKYMSGAVYRPVVEVRTDWYY